MANTNHTHLTVDEVASRWRVSPTFVRRAIWSGQISATRFGRAVRVPVAEAERFAESLTPGQGGRR